MRRDAEELRPSLIAGVEFQLTFSKPRIAGGRLIPSAALFFSFCVLFILLSYKTEIKPQMNTDERRLEKMQERACRR
jgi:hypothetical protein